MAKAAAITSTSIPTSISLDDKYTLDYGHVMMSGTQALVRLPMLQAQRDAAAGLNTAGFISGYRGSPLGGYDLALWKARNLLKQHNIKFVEGINEDLAATAVWGTQQLGQAEPATVDGVFALWYGKGPGLDRSGDVIKHGNYAGAQKSGGVLLVCGDDHGCKSSTLAMQSEPALMAAAVPVLYPATVQEYLDYGLYGWAMSRYSGAWVGFKAVVDLVETTTNVLLDADRVQITLPDLQTAPYRGAKGPFGALEVEYLATGPRLQKAQAFVRANGLDRVTHSTHHKKLGIVTAGKAWGDVCEALRLLGIDAAQCESLGISVYKLAMVWPVEPEGLQEWAQGFDEIMVIEEKRPLIEDQLARILYDWTDRPRLVGKYEPEGGALLPAHYELNASKVAAAIARRLGMTLNDTTWLERAQKLASRENLSFDVSPLERKTWYCAGCPHNTSTVVPVGSRAGAGIGCHIMALWMDRDTATLTQMGGEGVNWIGQAPWSTANHIFQNLGDGTYFHSGSLAVRAAVAAKVNITFKILYNDAVAMTGGQKVEGNLLPWQITQQMAAESVQKIIVVTDEPDKYPKDTDWAKGVTIRHRDDMDAVQQELRAIPGVTILLYDQTCAAEKRRRRKRGQYPDPDKRVVINSAVCEGCGDCGIQSNCVAIKPLETEFGRKRSIDQSDCNKDFSCIKGFCPSFVTLSGAKPKKTALKDGTAALSNLLAQCPEPVQPVLDENAYHVLITGIGGTGVITIGALLSMAAHLEGKGASVMDQTGLAQKNGAVTSHLKIAAKPEYIHGARIGRGQADLLLGGDLVVTAGEAGLGVSEPGRTAAVVNDHLTPIADFALHPDQKLDGVGMRRIITRRLGADKSHFIDAGQLATALLGNSIATNLFLVGYAAQKGLLPVSLAAIEQAITLNAVAVEMNKAALNWGRVAAHSPKAVMDVLGKDAVTPDIATSLDDIIARRIAHLTAYQNAALAEKYRALVAQVQQVETRKCPGSTALTEAVARYYSKLLSYKDEYEVARLYSDGAFRQKLAHDFDGDVKLTFHLAPPLFAPKDPHSGLPRKITFGGWMLPAFGLLAKLKFLRGTALDIFGYSAERKTERGLIRDYEALIAELLIRLAPENLALAVELASIPELIRGFGHVKHAHLVSAREKQASLLIKWRDPENILVDAA